MYAGHNRDEWMRLSVLLAHMANMNRDLSKKHDPFEPADFDIHDSNGELKKVRKIIKPTLKQILRQAFPNGKEG